MDDTDFAGLPMEIRNWLAKRTMEVSNAILELFFLSQQPIVLFHQEKSASWWKVGSVCWKEEIVISSVWFSLSAPWL